MTAPRNFAVLVLAFLATVACGDDDDEDEAREEVTVERGHVRGLPPADDAPASEACVRFCAKSNECAESAGRSIPPSARDCEASCGPGGPHRLAPAAVLACVDQPCGEAFTRCTRTALLGQASQEDIGVFPPICQGLCAKAAWCARRAGEPLGTGEDDCEAACRPGGAYADVSEDEAVCANEPCGPLFARCRANGGPDPSAAPAPGGSGASPSP